MLSKIYFLIRVVIPLLMIIMGFTIQNKYYIYLATFIVFTFLILKETTEFWNKAEKLTFEEFKENKINKKKQ
jgi:Ca2+/Na+ antiporter